MVTSLSALTLEVYYRYLPLYQLDGGPADGSRPAASHAGGPGGRFGPPGRQAGRRETENEGNENDRRVKRALERA